MQLVIYYQATILILPISIVTNTITVAEVNDNYQFMLF